MTGGLKSWRELMAMPLTEAPKEGGEKNPAEAAATNTTNPQTADLLRVEFVAPAPTNRKQTPPVVERESEPLSMESGIPDPGIPPIGQRCFIKGCPAWPIDIAYCQRHRERADSGELWGPR